MKLGAVTNALMVERTAEAAQPEALFARASMLGLQHIELSARGWQEGDFVPRVGELQRRYGIVVGLGFGDDYVANGADQPVERFAEFVARVCLPLDARVIGTVSPVHGGRWRKDVPLAYQLDQLAAALGRLAPVAERADVILAIENHADYRGSELADVLQRVGSRAVGARFDSGNTYVAIEEPVAAAEALAPYTVSTHIKDVLVEGEPGNRKLPGGLMALREVALGDGHVDLPRVVQLLAERGPLGQDLVLTIECPAAALEASVAYARRGLGAFLEG